MKASKKDRTVVWARVPRADMDDIERALPRWGWRTAFMSFCISYLAQRVRVAERPSMETLAQYGKEAVDAFVDNQDLDR